MESKLQSVWKRVGPSHTFLLNWAPNQGLAGALQVEGS